MNKIKLAFSPCPNDTFIFEAMVHGKIDTEGIEFTSGLHDVETLNYMALKGQMDVCKVSYHAFLYLANNYVLLDSGSALGSGNGPLLISKHPYSLDEIEKRSVAIPGEYTTANLLLKFAAPGITNKIIRVFSEIEDSVLNGTSECGVIIHENRFTYEKKGLIRLMDLGEYWEQQTQLPIPLGGIVVRKSLGYEIINKMNRIMRRSVEYAMNYPEAAMEYVKQNAREMDEQVMKKHIGLYVNDYTLDLGSKGKKAIEVLFQRTVLQNQKGKP
jgi:1,4-dihydroxy-6-naphthoate synthase